MYNVLMGIFVVIILWGLSALVNQLKVGLGVTGLQDQTYWGLYIITFVYFIGISLAGTLLSAVLKITGYHWQTPITRIAEVITGAALLCAAMMILVDMGRPERLLNVAIYGRIGSPLIWDVISLNTYLIGSLVYLYLPLIPDLALCRDRLRRSISPIRHRIYSFLALGWQNTSEQQARLEKFMKIMCIVIIPVGVSIHSVTAWIFGMTMRPGWDNTILAPYFVMSAFLSGTAMVIVVMSIFRKAFRLEQYFTVDHFVKLGWVLFSMSMIYAYFNFAEILTEAYKLKAHKKEFFDSLFSGQFAPLFWFFVFGSTVVPAILVLWRKTRTPSGITLAALLVVVGVWFKRYIFVIPTLQTPLMPFYYNFPAYAPTAAEISITLMGLVSFCLLIALFFRFFPIIPVWELTHEWEKREQKGGA